MGFCEDIQNIATRLKLSRKTSCKAQMIFHRFMKSQFAEDLDKQVSFLSDIF
jgi:hypothetical protein